MRVIQFDASVPRYAVGLGLRRIYPPGLWKGMSCTYASEVGIPELPGEDWVRVRTIYGGICGSDLSTIHLRVSPYFEPLNSYPFTFGHENIGVVDSAGEGADEWHAGDRVVAEPTLWCRPRGFTNLCEYCTRGEVNHCQRLTEGTLSAGVSIGFCRDSGGSWGAYFLAHRSQLYRIPESMTDENGLMVEPFATGLHAALLGIPEEAETVLIVGAGTIGLVTLAALRAIGCRSRILVLARYPFQAEAARRLGADEALLGSDTDVYQEVSDRAGGRVLRPTIGKRVLVGGVARTYDCVGSSSSLDDSLRLTREGGKVIVVGVPGIAKGVDWTSLFFKEVEVQGSYIYNHAETYLGEKWKTFDLAIQLLASGKVDLGWLVTHRFRLEEYDQALRLQDSRGRENVIKTVFDFRE
ncbi:MAG TPA: alcohol dehydrogenase catalytic domain-containing protein [Anaerolineales bacterium]|nr:alcohol dehydrogenase catalytic domain-containing protein [Anaerolineales bacterium]